VITVQSITIKEFRGVRDLTLDLGGKNFAVCGPNGTGKSGIVDALEFALTGSISRLSGTGTGGLSVKEHGPHVDSRNRPKDASVTLRVYIPSLKKDAVITRTVHEARSPVITPSDDDVRRALADVAMHPEFVLSRRELIRYVLAEPANRSKEVQALLKLNEVESLRATFQKISNAAKSQAKQCIVSKATASTSLLRALNISKLSTSAVLEAANAKRAVLGLAPLSALNQDTSLKDGITTSAQGQTLSKIAKSSALDDLENLNQWITHIATPEFKADVARSRESLIGLQKNEDYLEHANREAFLRNALAEFDEKVCPVCDTDWDANAFREHLGQKLNLYADATTRRQQIEKNLAPILAAIQAIRTQYEVIARYGSQLKPVVLSTDLTEHVDRLTRYARSLQNLLPLTDSIATLDYFADVPQQVHLVVNEIAAAVGLLPEPSQQDAARDFLIVGQERLEVFQQESRNSRDADQEFATALKVFETYGQVTTAALDAIYKNVEGSFSELYRQINSDDEADFKAKLQPSLGKLGFDVDFYGRGFFPPGAYHSEGHQDGMGLCLYLALMEHLSGKSFTFAVLDDVLMSVDSGHRREVSQMLKSRFPKTQFLFTTHDDIWLKHMKTVGLVEPDRFAHFRTWSVDLGPTEWDGRDVWEEIAAHLYKSNIREAAALLRHYLEYFSKEACHGLRAQVEFRGDAQFTLGDLLPNAISKLKKLIKSGKDAAQSWGQTAALTPIISLENNLSEAVKEAQTDQWQINAAVHYNEWATFQKQDFTPVVVGFQNLVSTFSCTTCKGMYFVTPHAGQPEALRCSCGVLNVNLIKKG
jgi:FPC/CPF motif-containing protein YcgG